MHSDAPSLVLIVPAAHGACSVEPVAHEDPAGQVEHAVSDSSLAVFEALLRGQSIAGAAQSFGMNEQAVYKIRSRVRARIEQLIAEQTREEDRLVSQPE